MRMTRPYDMSKFRKEQNKKLKIKDGFFDPITWIDTGNFALNKMMSGDFFKGVPIGSVTTFAGEPASGKSYIVSGNIVKNALESGVSVILLDTENAVKKTWASALGVDTDNENIIRWSKRTINQVAELISDFMKGYSEEYLTVPREEQPPVLLVIDSIGNLETESGLKQFEEGDMKGDKGLFAKQLKALMKNATGAFDGFQVGMVVTNHTYKNQNQYSDHEDVITGGGGIIYMSDIVVLLNKSKLKLDDDGIKTKTTQGIISKLKCAKSRYAKPFEEVEVHIPYETGMDPYSGLFEMFEKILKKDGNSYIYFSKEQNKEYKLTKKKMDNAFFDMLMKEWDDAIIISQPEIETEH